MMKGGENVKDNQRKGISIRNLKLSDVRAEIAASTVEKMLEPCQLKVSLLE